MSFTDDWLQNGLPVYSGVKDRSTARRLVDRLGGPSGIKKAYQNNPDGTVTTVHTRGAQAPEITTTTKRPEIRAEYVEIDVDLRTYHFDHPNYHKDKDVKAGLLHPYLLKYIKSVSFTGGLTVYFDYPDPSVGDSYRSTRERTPNNSSDVFGGFAPLVVFESFYPRYLGVEGNALLNSGEYAEKSDGGRTFFPAVPTRSCDGLIFTTYTPIKTLTVTVEGAEITLYFLNPTDPNFKW